MDIPLDTILGYCLFRQGSSSLIVVTSRVYLRFWWLRVKCCDVWTVPALPASYIATHPYLYAPLYEIVDCPLDWSQVGVFDIGAYIQKSTLMP